MLVGATAGTMEIQEALTVLKASGTSIMYSVCKDVCPWGRVVLCVRARARVCVRVCVHVRVCVCVRARARCRYGCVAIHQVM